MWILLTILALITFFLTPLLVLCALPFAKSTNTSNIFPKWLQWLNTWDDPGCNQGMYEPQVASKMKYGWYIKTLYWLGWRNQMYGLIYKLVAKYDGSPVSVSSWWKFKIYSCQGKHEITWPMCRVSFGYKVHTLSTAKVGDPIMWVFMPAFWKTREY